jgi:hypothetical protein
LNILHAGGMQDEAGPRGTAHASATQLQGAFDADGISRGPGLGSPASTQIEQHYLVRVTFGS